MSRMVGTLHQILSNKTRNIIQNNLQALFHPGHGTNVMFFWFISLLSSAENSKVAFP